MTKIKIGTFNMNNLFERPKVMELDGFSETGKEVLDDVNLLNVLIAKPVYDSDTKLEAKRILDKYLLDEAKKEFFVVNEIRGKLYSVKIDGSGVSILAKGRNDWVGWIELTKGTTNEISLSNTAKVIQAIKVDILCTVEVDNRVALNRFNQQMLKGKNVQFEHCMVIDGNDERGIDVGLLSNFEITEMISHVDDYYLDSQNHKYEIFSRDCPEYKVKIREGVFVTILCNHLKSKGYGSQTQNNAKRKKQTNRIIEILSKYDLTKDRVVVAGDFNDTPKSDPLKKLLNLANLHNVFDSPVFSGERWTYCTGTDQIDYLLVSKPIFDTITNVKIERQGIFKKKNPSFPEVTSKINQASDHAAVWAEFEIF